MKKKLLAIILAMMMVVSYIPTNVFAQESSMEDITTSGLNLYKNTPSEKTVYKAGEGTITFIPASDDARAKIILNNATIDSGKDTWTSSTANNGYEGIQLKDSTQYDIELIGTNTFSHLYQSIGRGNPTTLAQGASKPYAHIYGSGKLVVTNSKRGINNIDFDLDKVTMEGTGISASLIMSGNGNIKDSKVTATMTDNASGEAIGTYGLLSIEQDSKVTINTKNYGIKCEPNTAAQIKIQDSEVSIPTGTYGIADLKGANPLIISNSKVNVTTSYGIRSLGAIEIKGDSKVNVTAGPSAGAVRADKGNIEISDSAEVNSIGGVGIYTANGQLVVTGSPTITSIGNIRAVNKAVDTSEYKTPGCEITVNETDKAEGADEWDEVSEITGYKYLHIELKKHKHSWHYQAIGNQIKVWCENDSIGECEYLGESNALTLKLTTADVVYTGEQYDKATVENKITEVTEATVSKIIYVASDGTESEQPPVNAGKYTAKITIGNQTATSDFEIKKADQNKPSVTSQDETIKGKQDGMITHVDSSMEYSNDGTTYQDITDSQLTGLKPGTYYVRYKEKANYNVSEPTMITIKEGKVLTVAVPEDQTGYALTVDNNEVNWNGNSTLKFELKQGYSKIKDFKILVNGKEIIPDENGQYKISNIKEDINITVEGVTDITAPTGEIKIASDIWKEFINKVTFGRFYKESQQVTISAEDQGSGIDKISYCISHKEMTKEEVEVLTEDQWTTYDKPFNINPNDDYVIYAKVIDKAGNTSYVSSDGIVIDQVKAIVNGVESGHSYTKTQTFTVDEKHLKEVKIDGNVITPDENGVYTLIPKEGTYIIEAIDKAGNVTTIEDVTVNWQEIETPEIKASTYNKKAQKVDVKETNEYEVIKNDGGINAGKYDVVFVLKDTVNYKWKDHKAGEKELTTMFVINPKEIDINWGKTSFNYDGKMHAPQATATGIFEGDEVKLTVIGSKKNPGNNYTAKVTAISDPNYKLSEKNLTKQFKIKESIKKTERKTNDLALNMGLKVKQYDNKIKVSYGKIKNASGYDVYVQYCGSDFTKKSLNSVNNGKKTNIVIKKVNGKKLDLKKNYKVYVIAYQKVDGKKIILAKSITAHIVGRKNTTQTNVKAVKATKISYQLETGKSAQIKGKTILVDKKKQPLSDNHAKELRYITSNSKVATVSKTGKIKAVDKGSCDIYVYARNGYAKKIKVTVK